MKITSLMLVLAFSLLSIAGCSPRVTTVERIPRAPAGQQFDPAVFTTAITNPVFTLPIGTKLVYEAQTDEGTETVEILIPDWTREIEGVTALVYWDRVFLDGELIEDTRDYIAQHTETGDVWYFGEDVDNYEDGVLVDHEGAWLTGVDGAQPGIWIRGQTFVGDDYSQEYYEGIAEDRGRTDAIDETVSVRYGSFSGCVKTFEYSPLFSETAYKYHCPGVAATVLEEDLDEDGEVEQRTELITVDTTGASGTALPDTYAAEGVVG